MNDKLNLNSAGSEDISLFKKLCSRIGLALIIIIILEFIIGIVIDILISLYHFVITGQFGGSSSFAESPTSFWFIQIIATIPAILLACNYLSKKTNQKIRPLFQLKEKFNFLELINYFSVITLFSVCLPFFIKFMDKFFLRDTVSSTAPDLSIPQNSVLATVLYFISICIVAPIFEELLFRGVIFRPLQKYGNWFAIIISSILFALFHGNLQQIISVFSLGIIFGILTVKTNSILPSIILHSINNLFAVASSFIISLENQQLSQMLGFTNIGLALLGLTILLRNIQQFRLENDTTSDIPTMKKYKLFFLSIPVIIYILYIIVSIVSSITKS